MTKRFFNFSQLTFTVLPAIFIGLLTVIVYSNTIHSGFIFDDHLYITDDPAIRVTELSPENLAKAAINGKPRNRLLPNLSFAINYYLGRYEVEGYHLFNIGVHILTGFFLFMFFRATLNIHYGRTRYSADQKTFNAQAPILFIAFSAACLWLLHPVQTQGVTYIVQRMTSLSAMFYILSLLLYVDARQSMVDDCKYGRILSLFAGSLLAGICAITSKENAATLPIMILLFEWFFFQNLKLRWSKKIITFVAATLLLFLLIAVAYLGENPFHRIVAAYDYRDYSLIQRVLTQFRVVIYYISLVFFPHPARLALDYDYPLSNGWILSPTTFLSALAIAALLVLSIYLLHRKHRLASFCILWFLGTLMIESSIIAIEIIYEHRLYLSMMMPVLFGTLAFTKILKPKWTAITAISIILLVFGTWAHQRNDTWKTPLTFWQDNHLKFPEDARVLNNLGLSLINNGKIDESIDFLRKSIRIQSAAETPRITLLEPMNNLASAYFNKQEYGTALEILERASRLYSKSYITHYNMGLVFQKMNEPDRALSSFKKALQLRPWSAGAMSGMGSIYFEKGDIDAAVEMFRKALASNPENLEARLKLASILMEMERINSATDHYEKAIALSPGNQNIHLSLGMAYARQRRFAEAVHHYKQAVNLQPNDTSSRFQLAIAYAMQKKYDLAIEEFLQIQNIMPDNPKVYYNIGCLYSLQNNPGEAVSWLRQAIEHGYANWEQLKSDPDLDNVRRSELFQRFINRSTP